MTKLANKNLSSSLCISCNQSSG